MPLFLSSLWVRLYHNCCSLSLTCPTPAGDMFENYCWNDDLMNLCRGVYAFTILLTYPIECFVARDVLETAFFREYQPQPFFRHAVLSVIIAILCMLLSFTTDCLGIILELNVSPFKARQR